MSNSKCSRIDNKIEKLELELVSLMNKSSRSSDRVKLLALKRMAREMRDQNQAFFGIVEKNEE